MPPPPQAAGSWRTRRGESVPGVIKVETLRRGGGQVCRGCICRNRRRGPVAQAAAECTPGREARVGGSQTAWESRAIGGRN